MECQELLIPRSISNFPPPTIKNTILRNSSLSTIDYLLKEHSTVIVEGEKNIGKTTVLTQYVENYAKDSIVLFINEREAASVTDSEICKDLLIQIKSIYDEKFEINRLLNETYNLSDLKSELSNLVYYLKYKKQKVTFVLDGVIDLEIKDSFVSKLFLILPFGKNIDFLISSSGSDAAKHLRDEFKKYTVPVLAVDEIREMIKSIDDKTALKILNSFRGLPDKISTISRLIANGEDIDSILNYNCESAHELYQMEYDLAIKDDISKKILGFIAFSRSKVTREEICSALDIQDIELESKISAISFVTSSNENIYLASPGYYDFIKSKLDFDKIYYIDLHIKKYRLDEKNKDIIYYYNEKGDSENVISYLNNENIEGIYRKNTSLTEVSSIVQTGLSAAISINDIPSINRFNLLKCAFTNLVRSEVVVAELECYLTEGDHAEALKLIDSNGAFEDKLQLYCIYAIYQKKNKLELKSEVLNKINFLFDKISNEKLSLEKATDIAADLLPVFPDKALRIINNLDELDTAGQNKSDAAFYRMSLLTLSRHGESLEDDLSNLTGLSDKRAEMFKSVDIFNPDSPADKIIEHVSSIKETGDRIFLLRSWIIKNFDKAAANKLVVEIVKLATESNDFSIDASLFSDLSKVLNNEGVLVRENYESLCTYLDLLKEKGPTLEYTKLVINIVKYEAKNCISSSKIIDLYTYLRELKDKSVALSSLCVLSLHLTALSREELAQDVADAKKNLFHSLLDSDAYHVDIFREAIEYESMHDLANAINWCECLNTLERRSKGISLALRTVFSKSVFYRKYTFNDIVTLFRKIKYEVMREDLYEVLVDYYFCYYQSKKNFTKLLRVLAKISSNFVKSECYIKLISKNSKDPEAYFNLNNILDKLKDSIAKTDGCDNKIELSFAAHKSLYHSNPDAANYFKSEALKLKDQYVERRSEFEVFNKACIDLVIRCIYCLEIHDLNDGEDLEYIISRIETLGSEIDKSYYLARLTSAFQKKSKAQQAEFVIERYILPLLEKYGTDSSKEFSLCCMHTLPVLFEYSYDIFYKYFSHTKREYPNIADAVIYKTMQYQLNDCLIYDPYNSVKRRKFPNVSYRTLQSLTKLVHISISENTLVLVIKKVLEAVISLKKSQSLTRFQAASIIGVFKDSLCLFPFANGISHTGYQILVKALIKNYDEKEVPETWIDLRTQAEQIPNISDRSFVFCELATLLPNKDLVTKKKLFDDAEALISTLSSELEKLNRYSVLCEYSLEVDQKISQSFFKSALDLCTGGENSNSKEARLRIIDMVNRFDESFSSSLATLNDDDPARVKAINDARKKKKEKEKLESQFKESDKISDFKKIKSNEKLAKVALENLGNLNAKSTHFNKKFNINNFILLEEEYPVDFYYKIMSFYIHYLAEVYPGASNFKAKIYPILEKLKINISLIADLLIEKEDFRKSDVGVTQLEESSYLAIGKGDKDKQAAVLFIRDWFTECKSEELIIIDPYFNFESLEILSIVIDRDPDIKVTVYTSFESRTKLLAESDDGFCEVVGKYWNQHIGKGALPEFTFTFIKYGPNKEFPIHDRYLYNDKGMLISGTSLNGLGVKISQLKKLNQSEMYKAREKFESIVSRKQKLFDGERLVFMSEEF